MTERHGEQTTEVLNLGGLRMHSMAVFSELSYLVWPEEGSQLAMDRSAVTRGRPADDSYQDPDDPADEA